MNWYDRLFAAMLARADRQQDDLYGERKRSLFADLSGTVVEIGPGTGVNLSYFPATIRWIGAEPNRHMHPYIREKAASLDREVEIHAATLSELALDAASVDAVVSTLVLCSVPDQAVVLQEIRRVLKPGGAFYFIEHVGASRGTWLRRFQQVFDPLWRLVADGCHLHRDTHRTLDRAGFDAVQYASFDLDQSLSLVRPHIMGIAR